MTTQLFVLPIYLTRRWNEYNMSLYQFTYLPYEKQRLLDFKSQGHIDYTYINVICINIYFSIAYYQIDLFSKKLLTQCALTV